MKIKVKGFALGILFLVLLGVALFSAAHLRPLAAGASAALTPEMYTKSDYLLNADGSDSTVTIQDFAQTVLAADDTTDLSDLTKVIPAEYLRTAGEERHYFYNGEDYGFYVRHRAVLPYNMGGAAPPPVYVLDIMLIDFVYIVDNFLAEFKLKVEPLFSETFLYADNGGVETWTRITGAYNLGSVHGSPDIYQDYRAKMRIANPRFAAFVLNENEKNVGDAGYDGAKDSGLSILQSRINYSGSKLVTHVDAAPLVDYGVNLLIGKAFGALGLGVFTDVLSLLEACSNVFTAEIVQEECNNEKNILQNPPGSTADFSKTRSLMVKPADQLAFLPGESYAEHIIILSDADKRTRVLQYCFFDIMWASNPAAEGQYLNEVDEFGERIPFMCQKQGTYFDSATAVTAVSAGTVIPYHLLINGNQTFLFSPIATGNYTINTESPVTIYCEGEVLAEAQKSSFNVAFEQGKEYTVIVESDNGAVDSVFTIDFDPPSLNIGGNSIVLAPVQSVYYRLNGINAYYRIASANSNFEIIVYDSDFKILQNGLKELRIESENKTKYVELKNLSASAQTFGVQCNREKEVVFVSEGVNVPALTIINDSCTALPVPEREGFIFDGWYTNSLFTGGRVTAEYVEQTVQPSITLYAKWIIDNDYTYSIQYVIPESTFEGNAIDMRYIQLTGVVNEYTAAQSVALPGLESVKYSLAGWYYDESFSERCNAIPQGSFGNKILYAKIEMRTYTVVFNSNGGTACTNLYNVQYQEKIILPESTRGGYIGNWGAWGEKVDGEYQSNFGSEYEVLSDVTLVVQWKRIYNIYYKNLAYGSTIASVVDHNDTSAINYYVAGEGLDLNNIKAVMPRGGAYWDYFEFCGWYQDDEFKYSISAISATKTGNVDLYAKWQYTHNYLRIETTGTVTDAGEFSGKNYYTSFPVLDLQYDNLINMGITELVIYLYVNMWEVNDGYQEIFLYGDATKNHLLWSDTEIEHGPGKKLTTPGVYKATVRIDLAKLKSIGSDVIYIRFGAHGSGEDNWKLDCIFIETYAAFKDDEITRDENFAIKNPLD